MNVVTVPVQGRFRRQIGTEFCRFRFVCISARNLIRSQGISVATVIGFVAAADTGRFERAEDGERVGVIFNVADLQGRQQTYHSTS